MNGGPLFLYGPFSSRDGKAHGHQQSPVFPIYKACPKQDGLNGALREGPAKSLSGGSVNGTCARDSVPMPANNLIILVFERSKLKQGSVKSCPSALRPEWVGGRRADW